MNYAKRRNNAQRELNEFVRKHTKLDMAMPRQGGRVSASVKCTPAEVFALREALVQAGYRGESGTDTVAYSSKVDSDLGISLQLKTGRIWFWNTWIEV